MAELVIGVTVLFALTLSALAAELPDKKLEKLADDIQQALQTEKPEQKEPRPISPRDSSSMLLTTLRGAIARADLGQLQTVLEQLVAYLDSAALRDRCTQAAEEVRVLREAKEKETLAEIDRAVKRATTAVREAMKSSDLDEILLELGKFRNMRQDQFSSREVSSALAEMEHVIRFVTYWQDYIAQSEGGDTKAAQDTLRRMVEIPPNTLIPRSELLARRYGVIASQSSPSPSAAPSATQAPMAPLVLKTPDDLIPAIEKMTALFNTPNQVKGEERTALQHFIGAMTSLSNAYAEFKAGLTTKLEIVASDPSRPDKFGPVLAPIRAQVLKLVLPRYLGLPPALAPKPDEGVQEFLDRVKMPEINRPSQAALYVTAHNQEIAGQYDLAVASYQRALASGTDLIPPKVIGDRLARIKAEHPTEFAAGLEAFLTPRMPAIPPEFMNYFPGGLPGPPRRPGPPQNPVMQVPAASPSPFTFPAPAPSSGPPSKP
ncbi:MAG: hypothetical protein DME97_02590 [Verrucomicrobia bacterium]|nr:MAG: hypothetical protein DME97_02590 [Verrucomicrobiota bacterium]